MNEIMNANPPVHTKLSISIKAPAECVWNLISDVAQWPQHFSHVQQVDMQGSFIVGNSFSWKSNGIKIVSTIREIAPFTRIYWTGKAIGTNASHAWELRSVAKETFLETTEYFDGWLVKLMPNAYQKMLDKTLAQWLLEIKRKAEA